MPQELVRLRHKMLRLFRTHQTFVFVVTILLILIFTVVRINNLSNLPEDQQYLTQQSQGIKTVRFNQDAIEKIQSLNESNVKTPGTQLPQNRENPFSE